MLICLIIRLGGEKTEVWGWGYAAICFGFIGAWFAIAALILGEMEVRKPLLPVNEYAKLKRNTVKKVRKKWKAGELTEPVLRRYRSDFLLAADALNIIRNQSELDWETEIQWRVKR